MDSIWRNDPSDKWLNVGGSYDFKEISKVLLRGINRMGDQISEEEWINILNDLETMAKYWTDT